MRERPILFSGSMIRAILSGAKRQTRRIVKPQPAMLCRYEMNGAGSHALHLGPPTKPGDTMSFVPPTPTSKDHRLPCPYGAPGDKLWVREAWSHDAPDLDTCRAAYEDASGGIGYGPYYRATEVAPDTLRWKPSIHMPRWASRISLAVTSIRVERLQAITEEDAKAEGVERDTEPCDHTRLSCEDIGCLGPTYRSTFAELWDSINADRGSWASNPFVWVVAFERVEAAERAA